MRVVIFGAYGKTGDLLVGARKRVRGHYAGSQCWQIYEEWHTRYCRRRDRTGRCDPCVCEGKIPLLTSWVTALPYKTTPLESSSLFNDAMKVEGVRRFIVISMMVIG